MQLPFLWYPAALQWNCGQTEESCCLEFLEHIKCRDGLSTSALLSQIIEQMWRYAHIDVWKPSQNIYLSFACLHDHCHHRLAIIKCSFLTLKGENPSFSPSSLLACNYSHYYSHHSPPPHHQHPHPHHHHHHHLQLSERFPGIPGQVQAQAVCKNPLLVALTLTLTLTLLLVFNMMMIIRMLIMMMVIMRMMTVTMIMMISTCSSVFLGDPDTKRSKRRTRERLLKGFLLQQLVVIGGNTFEDGYMESQKEQWWCNSNILNVNI